MKQNQSEIADGDSRQNERVVSGIPQKTEQILNDIFDYVYIDPIPKRK